MQVPDLINGMFEALGGFMILRNCWVLFQHKLVRGVSVGVTTFFTSWGFWNLYYYPSLDQWLSFYGGVGLVIANSLWITMAIYYTRKAKEHRGMV